MHDNQSMFLDAPSHLCKRLCPSVGPSVRRSVRWSRVIFVGEKHAILGASCAVYPALFYSAFSSILPTLFFLSPSFFSTRRANWISDDGERFERRHGENRSFKQSSGKHRGTLHFLRLLRVREVIKGDVSGDEER